MTLKILINHNIVLLYIMIDERLIGIEIMSPGERLLVQNTFGIVSVSAHLI